MFSQCKKRRVAPRRTAGQRLYALHEIAPYERPVSSQSESRILIQVYICKILERIANAIQRIMSQGRNVRLRW